MHISSIILAVFYFFGIEEELLALLVYSSFQRVATSGHRIIPYSSVVLVVYA